MDERKYTDGVAFIPSEAWDSERQMAGVGKIFLSTYFLLPQCSNRFVFLTREFPGAKQSFNRLISAKLSCPLKAESAHKISLVPYNRRQNHFSQQSRPASNQFIRKAQNALQVI